MTDGGEDLVKAADRAAARVLPDEALGAAPGPKSVLVKVLSAALSGGLVVLLFAVIIPAIGSLSGVWDAIRSMSWEAVLLFVVVALVIRVLLAQAYAVLIPGLSLFRSLIAREASSAVSNVVPGPSGTATQYVILRSWRVSTESFASATISVGVVTDVLVFSAPGFLFLIWTLLGMPANAGNDNVWAIGLGALAVSVIAVAVVAGVASKERLAAATGRVAQRCANPFRRLAHKPRITDWPDRFVELRASTLQQLKDREWAFIGCIFGGYLLNGLLLVWCIWDCGVERSALAAVARPDALLGGPDRDGHQPHARAVWASPRWSTPRCMSQSSVSRATTRSLPAYSSTAR